MHSLLLPPSSASPVPPASFPPASCLTPPPLTLAQRQLEGCRTGLLGIAREDGSNVLLYGCFRAMRMRLNAIAEQVDSIAKDPANFADAANSQLGTSSVRYPSFKEVTGSSAERKLMENFSALNDLLSAAVQLSSCVAWQQFSSFQLLQDKLTVQRGGGGGGGGGGVQGNG